MQEWLVREGGGGLNQMFMEKGGWKRCAENQKFGRSGGVWRGLTDRPQRGEGSGRGRRV